MKVAKMMSITASLFVVLLMASNCVVMDNPDSSSTTATSTPTATLTPAPTTTFTPTPTTDPDAHLRKYEGDFAFKFVNGSEEDMPIPYHDSPGYRPHPDDPREQIVIDETFKVPSGEEVTFEDKIVWVRPKDTGTIDVFGTLIIKNSLLLWDQTEHHQVMLGVKPGGLLHVESSYVFSTNQFWFSWDCYDGGTVYLDHYVGSPPIGLFGSVNYTAVNFSTVYVILFYDMHDANVKVSDAHSLYFEIHPAPGTYEVSLPAQREWIDWDLSDLWPNSTIEITHSYLFEKYFTLSADNHITIRDSTDVQLGWHIRKETPGVVECELRNMGDPDRTGGVFYENQTWDLPCINASLTMINSHLLQAYPQITGEIHLRVYNSNLIDPRARGNSAVLEVYDSTLENVAAVEGGKVYLENVRVKHDIEVKGFGSVIYAYNVSPWETGWKFEIIERDGGRFIELDNPGPPW